MGVLRGRRPPVPPSRATPDRAGPSRAELGLVEPSWAESGRVWPSRAGQEGGGADSAAWTVLRTYRPAGHRAKSP